MDTILDIAGVSVTYAFWGWMWREGVTGHEGGTALNQPKPVKHTQSGIEKLADQL